MRARDASTVQLLRQYCSITPSADSQSDLRFFIVMINTKIGSRWHCINRAHLQIPLDPLLPIEQEFPRLSAYDRAYSGSYHVDLYYRPVSRWMMGHAVKAKRKWLKEDICADLQAEFWLLLFKRKIALSLFQFRLCEWRKAMLAGWTAKGWGRG